MKRFWLAAWMLMLAFAGSAFAAPFTNGSFEIGASSTCGAGDNLPAGSTAIPGWTVSVGNIDWAGPCNWDASNNQYSLDLVGGSTSVGGISQTFDTVTGATYQVWFDLAGNPSLAFPPAIKPLSVTVAGTTHNYTFDTTGRNAPDNMGWTPRTFTFTAIGPSSTIDFVSNVGISSFAGAALDNVSIVRTFAATSTGLFSSANPSTFGSSVTFTVQVLGTINSPTGTIDFTDNESPISGCTAVALGPTGSPLIATADCITSSLAVGSHTIAATYSGNVLNAGSSNTLTQVVNAVVIGATAWTGSAGSVFNPGQGNATIGSLPSVVSNGTAGQPAVFTYETVNNFCCHTGDWNFETIATTSGSVTRNWTYSGYHGTCQAQVSLTPYIRHLGATTYGPPLYSASDAACNGAPPSGGFGQYGQAVFAGVIAGDTYGFKMHASNFDSNGEVLGRLTVTTGTLPTTTTVGSSANPVLYGTSVRLTATVTGSAPTGTVTFTQEGRIMFGCDAVPVFGGSAGCWTILPLGPRNIVALYTGDTVNAGSVSSALLETVNLGSPPASFVVNSTADAPDAIPGDGICADSLNRCTLRAAILEANALGGAATITVPAGTYVLGIGVIAISADVTINGAGAASTIVDGAGLDRVFTVGSRVVAISGLTVRNGHTNGANAGAGIANSGSLTLNQVVVSGNTSGADAGGIFNQGTLVLNGSTVSGNTGGGGAGIYSFNSTLTLINSTVSGNHSIGIGQCGFGGGGMWIYGGQATITNSTLFANFAECSPGFGGRGHAIASTGATVTIRNSIVASPTLGAQVCYGAVTSLGGNLAGDGTCGPVATDLVIADPLLAPLADNGGPTPTHAPYVGSPTIDAVPMANCASALDQRRVARPQGPACDIGAVEGSVPQPPPTFAAPILVRVITTSSSEAYLIGRADGALGTSVTFNAYSASSCNAGALVGGIGVGTFTAATDASGYFGVTIPVNSGNFVAVQLTAPSASGMSACAVSTGDNDFWPKALPVVDGSPSPRDFIDASGKARWYKFSVTPGQKIQVTLSGLPADYDLTVFKDINQAFLNQLVPGDAAALTKLSAEFAPSTFSPSTFSPSTFSPSTFSPDAYAPSTFSPSTFSPSTFSPSTFSPSTFSPSTFSPSTFSPSTFSPSTFSPSTFSPSTFSPSTFSPSSALNFTQDQVAQAFSSAQTRSIIGVSATPGAGDESVVLNTWNNTGNFYVRVAGRGGAFSTAGQFTLTVAKGAETCTSVAPLAPITRSAGAAAVTTVILTDGSKIALDTALPNGGTLRAKLAALGVVIDVDSDGRVRTLKAQAAANTACPYATNLVAEEIKSIVDSYRASNPLRYVVIAGNDGVIPFFRYPDESLLGQESGYVPPVRNSTPSDASLSRDYVLSQDAYGSSIRVAMRAIDFPIPGLAVGRLVETPAEIAGVIDAYLANAVVAPSSALVTGYDFLANVADAVKTELQTGGIAATQALITLKEISPKDSRSWTATQLGTALFGSRHDVVFLAGHFSANSALAADFTTSLLTTDLAASTTDFTNSIVFSAGCHAGYNIVDPDAIDGVTLKLDWPQAFAQKKATLIAGTGYQYGDTDFIEYSARLYRNFSRQLRAGAAGTAVSVGEALARAKSDYLATTPDIRGIHQKALLETTLYGLPMLGVNMSAGRQPNAGIGGVIATLPAPALTPAATLGLQTFDYSVSPAFQTNTLVLKNLAGGVDQTATWLSTSDGIVSNPAEPALPLVAANVTPIDSRLVLRGVGFLGGNYSESTIVPLTGAPTTELRGVHTPFLSPEFFPMRLTTPNYFGALSTTGGTKLLITPAQHRAADVTQGTSILRQFNGLNLRLYYSGNTTATALSAAPTITSVGATSDSGGGLTFVARVVGDPAAAIHEVWVTYTGGSGPTGTWTSISLAQCSATPPPACGTTTDSQQWMARLDNPPSNLKYIAQAVNGIGLVSADDNLGAYYSAGATAPVATTLALTAPPAGAAYGATTAVSAKLSANAVSVTGKRVTVSLGGTSQTGVTDGNGNVTVIVTVSSPPGTYPLTASFSGDEGLLPSAASSSGFVVTKASSNLAPLSPLGATLTGTIGGKTLPIDGSVAFTLTSSRSSTSVTTFAITDYLGQAVLPPPGLPAGNYTITSATFSGNATYNATTLAFTAAFTIPKANQTINFAQPPSHTYGDADFALAATTTSGLTASYAASGGCTVTGASVHITASGSCTITASQAGNDDFNAAAPIPQTFAIARTTLIVTPTVSPPSFTYGDDLAPPTVAYGATYSGTLACLLNPTPLIVFSGKPPAAPASASTYTIVPAFAAGQVSPSCDIVANSRTLTVNQAQATFTNIVAPPTAPVRTAVSITGQLNRLGKPSIYPKAADLVGGAFAVALKNAGGTVKTYSPSLSDPIGSFAITDNTLAPDTYSLEFNYTGGPNFLAATKVVSALRVVGFASSGSMSQARTSHTATLLNDGRVLIAGGVSVSDDRLRGIRTAEIYCPNPYTPPATPARTLAQWCPNGVGKFSPAGRGNTTQIGVGNMVQARAFHTATLLPDGTVLLTGGYNGSDIFTSTAEIYDATDPIADRFTAVGSLPSVAVLGHTATLISKNGTALVLVVGGLSASSQLYNPTTRTWSLSGAMTGARFNHTASLVGVGGTKVLVAGGIDLQGKTLQTTTIYNVGTGTFSSGPTMLAPRELHTATAIANGKVLLAGGTGGPNNTVAFSPLAEIYDPANATTPFVPTGFASNTGRFAHSASSLGTPNAPDGRVLIAGGSVGIACNQVLATSELYTSGFTSGAAMTAARVSHTATVLKDGRVLIAGGIGVAGNTCAPLNTTEIWNAPPP